MLSFQALAYAVVIEGAERGMLLILLSQMSDPVGSIVGYRFDLFHKSDYFLDDWISIFLEHCRNSPTDGVNRIGNFHSIPF